MAEWSQKASAQKCKERGAEKKFPALIWRELREGMHLERSEEQLGRNEDLKETELLIAKNLLANTGPCFQALLLLSDLEHKPLDSQALISAAGQ